MAQQTSAKELRAQLRASMGDELGELFYHLWQHAAALHGKWADYKATFAAPEAVGLLKATAPRYFGALRQTLLEDIMLRVCKLTDKPEIGKNKNLSVSRLTGLLSDQSLKHRVEHLLAQLDSKTDFARQWRNRRLAHLDLERVLNPSVSPLPPATQQHIEEALVALRSLLNAIELPFLGSATAFELALSGAGGPGAMLYFLRLGLDTENAKQDEVRKHIERQRSGA